MAEIHTGIFPKWVIFHPFHIKVEALTNTNHKNLMTNIQ